MAEAGLDVTDTGGGAATGEADAVGFAVAVAVVTAGAEPSAVAVPITDPGGWRLGAAGGRPAGGDALRAGAEPSPDSAIPIIPAITTASIAA